MATKLYDLVVVTGSYTGRDGKQRNNYKNIGSVMQNDKGAKFLMMDATFHPVSWCGSTLRKTTSNKSNLSHRSLALRRKIGTFPMILFRGN